MSGVTQRFYGDRPYTPRECADFMGLTPEWIRKAITEGVPVRGITVKLEAEALPLKRRLYRIHEHKFIEFLLAIGWKHLPRLGYVEQHRTAEASAGATVHPLHQVRGT